jgi:hypothetical protein
MARILIPISLWFWVDLNEEIEDQPQGTLKLALNSWRWAMTIYGTLGALTQVPFAVCFVQNCDREFVLSCLVRAALNLQRIFPSQH